MGRLAVMARLAHKPSHRSRHSCRSFHHLRHRSILVTLCPIADRHRTSVVGDEPLTSFRDRPAWPRCLQPRDQWRPDRHRVVVVRHLSRACHRGNRRPLLRLCRRLVRRHTAALPRGIDQHPLPGAGAHHHCRSGSEPLGQSRPAHSHHRLDLFAQDCPDGARRCARYHDPRFRDGGEIAGGRRLVGDASRASAECHQRPSGRVCAAGRLCTGSHRLARVSWLRSPPTDPGMGAHHEREPIAHHLLAHDRPGARLHARLACRWAQSFHGRSRAHPGSHCAAGREMSDDPLVKIVNLDFSYREGNSWAQVLHRVNFTITRGEVFGLVGESGCGKSTVAYQLMAYRRDNGRIEGGGIFFKDADLQTLDRPSLDHLRGNRISLVPQNPTTALSPGMRVGRQVAEVLEFHAAFKSQELPRIEELFSLVGLPDPSTIGHRYPHQLSGGQQQRVAIAMALACEPDLLVLDEPTTGLDVTTQEQIVELLKDLRTRLRMSMLYVTHDLGVLAQIADRVGVMYAGRMVEIAPTAELFALPRHPYTRGLIASIPQIDQVNRASGIVLRGLLKRDQLPRGCPFQPRCDFADPVCADDVQILEVVGEQHQVACHRWRNIAASRRDPVVRKADPPVVCSEPLLAVEHVRLSYGRSKAWLSFLSRPEREVVQDLSFTIRAGETFALVGESGSGKSTIARAASGLLPPMQGTISFEGHPLPALVGARPGEIRRQIQYVFQNPDASLNPRATIGTILARPIEMFFGASHRWS